MNRMPLRKTMDYGVALSFYTALLVLVTRLPARAHPPQFHLAQAAKDEKSAAKKMPNFAYDLAAEVIDADVLDNPLWYDADVASHDGRLWYAWLEYTPGKGDQIWIGARQDDQWTLREKVSETIGSFSNPTLTADAQGRLWLSYEAESNDQWDVLAGQVAQGKVAKVARVSPGKGTDIRHRAAADPQGGIWVAWQSDRDGQFDVLLSKVTVEQTTEPMVISQGRRGDWHPSVACDTSGKVHVAWDAFDGESFNVHLRSVLQGKLGPVIDVASTPAFEGRAQVVADRRNRVWVAWEEGGGNWGRAYRPKLSTLNMSDQLGPLHRLRVLHLAAVDSEGTVREVEQPLPMPALEAAERRTGTSPGLKRSGAFYERVRLSVDDGGRLWLAYRHFYTPWLGIVHRSHVEAGWGLYARYLGDDGWSDLYRFGVTQGDGLQSLEITPHADGIAAVWTTGRTHREKNRRPRGIVVASVAGRGGELGNVPLAPPRKASPVKITNPPPATEAVEHNGKRYRLFYGDLHRHTDLSLCRVPIDGTIDDAYRYASDVARLDFLGITDHSRDLALGDALSLLWWRCRKEVYRHELAKTFLPFYAYERSHSNTADHNVISLRGDMLRPHTYPVPEFWKEIDPDTTIMIPHQPIRRDTWKYQDDLRRPLAEIFQGARDRSIAEDIHRGLDKGYHLGIIASSDHMSTSASYACVWAEDATRESIFRAMKDRRTFGATSNIRLIFRAGQHWMGEQITVAEPPELTVQAIGTAPIRSLNFLVDGKVVKTLSPGKRELDVREELALAGKHYVYVHLIQADGNEAWSSPIWITTAAGR